MNDETGLVACAQRVADIAAAIARAGVMAFDIEFVSEGRFVPELSLIQVAWGDPETPHVAAIDCLAVDPAPLLALVADGAVEMVTHAARQDLGLLATRFGIEARALWDTQIAAAFAGLGEQIGYARLIEVMCGEAIDKGQQFTAWLDRPLTAEQLQYALDDVRHLLLAWQRLRARLDELGRLAWVREESAQLASSGLAVGPPETAYLDVKGWKGLRGAQLAALVALAAWRRREAVEHNKPPSWIVPDAAMLELARRRPDDARGLRAIRGIGEGTARRYGKPIIAALQRGARRKPPPLPAAKSPLGARAELWSSVLLGMLKAQCEAEGLAARFVATRSDVEAMAAWFDAGCEGEPPALVTGWRREFAGERALAWLRGEIGLRAGQGDEPALVLAPVRASPDPSPGRRRERAAVEEDCKNAHSRTPRGDGSAFSSD